MQQPKSYQDILYELILYELGIPQLSRVPHSDRLHNIEARLKALEVALQEINGAYNEVNL